MLHDHNNQHPLAGDLSMYFRGTYVAKELFGVLRVMYVREVSQDTSIDSNKLRSVRLHGDTIDTKGSIERDDTWTADNLLDLPKQGYRLLGTTPYYISYSSENRSNKKGLDPRKVKFNGKALDLTLIRALVIYEDKPFRLKFSSDLIGHKGTLLWRGLDIGTFKDGVATIKQDYEYLEDYVCKVLARFLETVRVSIQTES